jgi:hypothetical protein
MPATYDDAECFSDALLRCASIDGHNAPSWEIAAARWRWQAEPERVGVLVYDLPASAQPSGWDWVRWGAMSCRMPAIMLRGLRRGRARDFAGGHELGHIVRCLLDVHLADDVHAERWCNRFAASLLAPAATVRSAWRRARASGERVGRFISALNPTALALRLGETGCASVSILQRSKLLYAVGPMLLPANDIAPLVRLALRDGRADGGGMRAYRLSDGAERVAVMLAA